MDLLIINYYGFAFYTKVEKITVSNIENNLNSSFMFLSILVEKLFQNKEKIYENANLAAKMVLKTIWHTKPI